MNRGRDREAEQRSLLLLELLELAEQIQRANIRRRFPVATREELDRRLTDWYLGREDSPPKEFFRERIC